MDLKKVEYFSVLSQDVFSNIDFYDIEKQVKDIHDETEITKILFKYKDILKQGILRSKYFLSSGQNKIKSDESLLIKVDNPEDIKYNEDKDQDDFTFSGFILNKKLVDFSPIFYLYNRMIQYAGYSMYIVSYENVNFLRTKKLEDLDNV